MTNKTIVAIRQKLEKAKTPELRESMEKKLAKARERYDITHDIEKVSGILDESEVLFDDLEEKLSRTKQSLYYFTVHSPIPLDR